MGMNLVNVMCTIQQTIAVFIFGQRSFQISIVYAYAHLPTIHVYIRHLCC